MKNRLLPLVFAFLAVTSVSAQQCGTHEGSFEEQQQKYPDFYQGIESQNTYLNKAKIKGKSLFFILNEFV